MEVVVFFFFFATPPHTKATIAWCHRLLRCNKTIEKDNDSLLSSFSFSTQRRGLQQLLSPFLLQWNQRKNRKKVTVASCCCLFRCNITKKKKLTIACCHRLLHCNITKTKKVMATSLQQKKKGRGQRQLLHYNKTKEKKQWQLIVVAFFVATKLKRRRQWFVVVAFFVATEKKKGDDSSCCRLLRCNIMKKKSDNNNCRYLLCYLFHCKKKRRQWQQLPSPFLLQHNQKRREGAYLQALLSFDDGGSHFKHSQALTMLAPLSSAPKL